MMFRPMLSAEQQRVVDGTHQDEFWEYWLWRHLSGNDLTEEGFPIVRHRGYHYVVKPKKDPKGYREHGGGSSLGHGGREFRFVLEDGTALVSNDVWFQGSIPLAYRQRMPDNAEAIEHDLSEFTPSGTPEQAVLYGISMFDHPTLAIDFHKARREEVHDDRVYSVEFDESTRRPAPLEEAQVWTSEVINVDPPKDGFEWGSGTFMAQHVPDSKDVVHQYGRRGPKATAFNGRMEQVENGWHTVMLDIDHPTRLVPSTTPGHWHLYIDVAMPWWRYRKLLRALAMAGIIETGYARASIQRGFTSLRLPWVKKEALQPPVEPHDEEAPY